MEKNDMVTITFQMPRERAEWWADSQIEFLTDAAREALIHSDHTEETDG